MLQPITDKREYTVRAGLKCMHEPAEDISKITVRLDNADETTAAIETDGFSDAVTPHQPNSNKAEVYSDLQRLAARAFQRLAARAFQDSRHVSGRYLQ